MLLDLKKRHTYLFSESLSGQEARGLVGSEQSAAIEIKAYQLLMRLT
jgi:hypothetical protein